MKKSREGGMILKRHQTAKPNLQVFKDNIYTVLNNIDQGMLEQMINIKAGNQKRKIMILLYNWINKDKEKLTEYKIKMIEKVFADKDVLRVLIFRFVGDFELKPQ